MIELREEISETMETIKPLIGKLHYDFQSLLLFYLKNGASKTLLPSLEKMNSS
jgi:hypothetical protein